MSMKETSNIFHCQRDSVVVGVLLASFCGIQELSIQPSYRGGHLYCPISVSDLTNVSEKPLIWPFPALEISGLVAFTDTSSSRSTFTNSGKGAFSLSRIEKVKRFDKTKVAFTRQRKVFLSFLHSFACI